MIRPKTCWLLSFALLCIPSWSHAQDPGKEKVLALSRKIDELIAAQQKTAGVTPAPRADDNTYFRRLNLDLIGRIPTLTDHRDFLDKDYPEKRWEEVERLLAHERFPMHFGNILRALMLQGSTNQQQIAGLTPGFEIWLRERLQKNVPYDRMVHELLNINNQNINYGMNVGSPAAFYFANENKPENLAAATTRVFLGVKLECAQCHAHPFAKWTREQFWEFAAFFSGPQQMVRGLQQPGQIAGSGKEIIIPGTKKVVKAKYLDGKEPEWKDGAVPRTVVADWITSPQNPYFAKAAVDHLWMYFFGVSLLEPIYEPSDDSPITHPELVDELARQLTEHKFDLKFLIRAIVHSEAYQRATTGATRATKEDYNLFTRMPVRGLTPEQLFDSVAEATAYANPVSNNPNPNFQPFNQPNTPRAEFLNRFVSQDKRHETHTSILQALFMMNGKFLAERIKPENNADFNTLVTKNPTTASKVDSLFIWVLSRTPRPDELDRLVRYVDSGGPTGDPRRALSDVYWALLNSAEFMLNH